MNLHSFRLTIFRHILLHIPNKRTRLAFSLKFAFELSAIIRTFYFATRIALPVAVSLHSPNVTPASLLEKNCLAKIRDNPPSVSSSTIRMRFVNALNVLHGGVQRLQQLIMQSQRAAKQECQSLAVVTLKSEPNWHQNTPEPSHF